MDPDMGRALRRPGGQTGPTLWDGRRRPRTTYKVAMSKLDRMTEREKDHTRGGYYLLTRNWDRAIDELSALVKQYLADSAGFGETLPSCNLYKRLTRSAGALAEGERASQIYPRNLEPSAATTWRSSPCTPATSPRRPARGGGGRRPSRTGVREGVSSPPRSPSWRRATSTRPWPPTASSGKPATGRMFAAYGLADVAMYQGRLADAASNSIQAVLKAPGLSPSATARATVMSARRASLGPGPDGRRGPRGRRGAGRQPALERAVPRRPRVPRGGPRGPRAPDVRGADAQPAASRRSSASCSRRPDRAGGGARPGRAGRLSGGAGPCSTPGWPAWTWPAPIWGPVPSPRPRSELDRAAERQGEAIVVFLDDIPSHRPVRARSWTIAPACRKGS